MSAPRLLLAEADTPVRMGLRLALVRGGFEVAAEARDASAAIEAARRHQPDAALVASDLPGDGIRTAHTITSSLSGTAVLVLTPRQNGEELLAAVLAGASGYLGKDMSQARLPQVLTGVLAGEVALPRRHTAHVLEALCRRDARRRTVLGRTRRFVTDREWEILELLGQGQTTAEMARRLGISEVTARRHISSVLPKLGVADREGAAALMRSSE